MVIHQCIKCNKEFQYPWMLRRHLERKYQCIVEQKAQQDPVNESLIPVNESSNFLDTKKESLEVKNPVNESQKSKNLNENPVNESQKFKNLNENPVNESQILENPVNESQILENPVNESLNINAQKKSKDTCIYCMKKFTRNDHCVTHTKTCKMKDDPIRQLEMKAKVEFEPPPPNTCRFCKLECSTSSNLSRHLRTCKEIEIYKEQLQLKVQQITNNYTTNNDNSTNIDNSITNNNITNNITINAIGSERIDHIALEKITQMLIQQGKEFVEESVYLISGNVVIEYQKMLREIPENRNLIIPSWRSPRALIKTPGNDEFIKMEIGEALDTSFRNTAKILFEKINEIKELRGGFSNEQTHEMHNLVKFLGSHGIKFAPFGQTHNRNEVKRRYKAINMADSNVL